MVEKQIESEEEINAILNLLNQQKAHDFREQYLDLHVYEQAQIFAEMDYIQRSRLYRYLTPEEVGEIFNVSEEEPVVLANYFEEMTPRYAAQVINSMYTDNAVDILAYAKKKNYIVLFIHIMRFVWIINGTLSIFLIQTVLMVFS